MGKAKDTNPPEHEDGLEVKIVKRYTNRKLYDTVESRYVTLDEIAEMIRVGEEVRIIDNRTKEDLTSVTLAQIIFEQEKRSGNMPLSVLRDIVRHGEASLQDFFEREISPRVASIREEAEQRLTRVFRRGDKLPAPPDPATEKETREYVHVVVDGLRHSVDEFQHRIADWQQKLSSLQNLVDDRVQSTLESVWLPGLHKDLVTLRTRLEELEKKISQLDEEEQS